VNRDGLRLNPSFLSGVWFDRLALAALTSASFVALAAVSLAPRDAAAAGDAATGVGVVYAPWVSGEEALSRAVSAGARFVRFGGVSFVVVVAPESADYAARAKAGGALFTVDPQALAACLPGYRGQGASS